MVRQLRDLLFPAGPAEDFRQELLEDVRFATLLVGGFETLLSLLLPLHAVGLGLALGIVTVAVAHVPACFGWLRNVTLISSYLWLALLHWLGGGSSATMAGGAAVVICLAAKLPLTPVEGLLHGSAAAALSLGLWPLPLLALAGAALTPFQYRYRLARFTSQLHLLQSTQELRLQQERALSAEHAASLERLAAAVSHELNTPVGAIKSSVQTLQGILKKYSGADADHREQLTELYDDVCECLLAATSRVKTIVERLQRLTSLDRAARRPTDLNQVLQDVVAVAEAATPGDKQIHLQLEPLPLIVCETQAWTTVLTRLVANAVEVRGQERIELRSSMVDGCVLIQLLEVGRETSRAHRPRGLDPTFEANGGRMGTSNWGLLQIRGWVRQLGGQLRVSSDGRAATTSLLIPAHQVAEAEAAAAH
jgi:signal transduction histidine kinase